MKKINTVFSWIEAPAFIFFSEKKLRFIFKGGLYSRAASIIYFVLIVCYLQVITSITFVFIYISFVFQFWKPFYCCRIQRNSKQFVNSFGIDCYIFGIARPTLDDDVYEIEVENIENVDDLTDKIIEECEMEILS